MSLGTFCVLRDHVTAWKKTTDLDPYILLGLYFGYWVKGNFWEYILKVQLMLYKSMVEKSLQNNWKADMVMF